MFVGDASFKYTFQQIKSEQQEQQPMMATPAPETPTTTEDNQSDQQPPAKPKAPMAHYVLEEVRLAYTIAQIDRDTCVVPRGSTILKANNEVALNENFAGLSHKEAGKLSNYIHLREPEIQKSLVEKDTFSRALDFADCIIDDVPNSMLKFKKKMVY